MEDASLYEDNKLWDFGEGRDVNTKNLHSELPVTVPHGDGEDSLVIFLIDGQLLMGTYEETLRGSVKPMDGCI